MYVDRNHREQLIENSQRVDVHPYEEAQGFQRVLDLPGYDVATLAEKTGKSDSLIYARLALLQLVPEVAEAFQEERAIEKPKDQHGDRRDGRRELQIRAGHPQHGAE